MTLSSHSILFALVLVAALLGFGWVLIVYVLSFHAAQWVVDRIDGASVPRRRTPSPAYRPLPRHR